MRFLLLSDLHANAVALDAVLRHADTKGWERVIFLGDAVGYYPQPGEVLARLRDLPLEAAVLGNHDAALLQLASSPDPAHSAPHDTSEGARGNNRENALHGQSLVTEVLARQYRTLSAGDLGFLTELPLHARRPGWEAVHGALSEPWGYLSTLLSAQLELPLMTRDVLFFGHTHVPAIYAFTEHPSTKHASTKRQGEMLTRSVPLEQLRTVYRLPPNARVLVNPGSVGQPRDGVPLASYALFDDQARVLEHYRVPFDVKRVQNRVHAAGYPESLATRLERGR